MIAQSTLNMERQRQRNSVLERPVTRDQLRSFASSFVTGVAIVTTCDEEGELFGLTMNSIASLSLDPPLYLICVDKLSQTLPALREGRYFAISVLEESQWYAASKFSSKSDAKFDEVPWHPGACGAPLISGALAWTECQIVSKVEAGDHIIIIGVVLTAEVSDGRPLAYFRGCPGSFTSRDEYTSRAS